MAHEATITSKGQVTIPKSVRERMGLEAGQKLLFRFDDDGVRIVAVPADPMDRLEAARERIAPLDLDAHEIVEAERRQWGRGA